MSKPLRLVYWLTDQVLDQHVQLKNKLIDHGLDVHFIGSVPLLETAVLQKRAAIIVVGDEPGRDRTAQHIRSLNLIPELQGCRFILSVSRYHRSLSSLAAESGYRDIIPLNLSQEDWVKRFVFATAPSPLPIVEPSTQIALNNSAVLSVPARIVWLSESRLLFESRMKPHKGARLVLKGPLSKEFGLTGLPVTVVSCRNTDLTYRFSDAVEAVWEAPEEKAKQIQVILKGLQQTDLGPRYKIFVAVHDSQLRSFLRQELEPLRFDVNFALRKQSIVQEPKYFTPDAVFIEDVLCQSPEDIERFNQMLEALSPDVPIIIIGPHVEIKKLRDLDPIRKIVHFHTLPTRLGYEIINRHIAKERRELRTKNIEAIYLTPDNPLSFAEVNCRGKLIQVHPQFVKLASSIELTNYGMVKVQSSLFQRYMAMDPYSKIIDSYENPALDAGSFPFVVESYLCEPDFDTQKKFALALTQYARDQILSDYMDIPHAKSEQLEAVPKLRHQLNDIVEMVPKVKLVQEAQEAYEQAQEDVVDEISPMTRVAMAVDRKIEQLADVLMSPAFWRNVLFLCIAAFCVLIFYLSVVYIAPNWERSGKQYNESLKKFAPDKFEHQHN